MAGRGILTGVVDCIASNATSGNSSPMSPSKKGRQSMWTKGLRREFMARPHQVRGDTTRDRSNSWVPHGFGGRIKGALGDAAWTVAVGKEEEEDDEDMLIEIECTLSRPRNLSCVQQQLQQSGTVL
jgi:methionine aminopeptidase